MTQPNTVILITRMLKVIWKRASSYSPYAYLHFIAQFSPKFAHSSEVNWTPI